MKICLECEHLETSWFDGGEGVPEFFRRFLRLYCKKKKIDVVGYDEKGDVGYCECFKKRQKREGF